MPDATDSFALLRDVDVRLSVELGRANMKLKDIMNLAEDSVVMLDRLVDEPLDVLVNGKLIARAEIVSEGGRFGMRILELANAANTPMGAAA
ncbi:MAG: flagellar motor switch protein FliN [Sphingomonadales bacterium 32-68-7]|nr:MAG: flagellar motor switch protein FliN [Sphingomonadales bacterium 12-68-11]OYX10172.1 MAG: flagellar motor switch protein FliN [Sphingomonadales bacterium 32-68-7]